MALPLGFVAARDAALPYRGAGNLKSFGSITSIEMLVAGYRGGTQVMDADARYDKVAAPLLP